MEGIHRIIIGLAEEFRQFLIIDIGNLTETLIGGKKIGRTQESVPESGISHIKF